MSSATPKFRLKNSSSPNIHTYSSILNTSENLQEKKTPSRRRDRVPALVVGFVLLIRPSRQDLKILPRKV